MAFTPNLGSFATIAALNSAFPPSSCAVGTTAFCQDANGAVVVNQAQTNWVSIALGGNMFYAANYGVDGINSGTRDDTPLLVSCYNAAVAAGANGMILPNGNVHIKSYTLDGTYPFSYCIRITADDFHIVIPPGCTVWIDVTDDGQGGHNPTTHWFDVFQFGTHTGVSPGHPARSGISGGGSFKATNGGGYATCYASAVIMAADSSDCYARNLTADGLGGGAAAAFDTSTSNSSFFSQLRVRKCNFGIIQSSGGNPSVTFSDCQVEDAYTYAYQFAGSNTLGTNLKHSDTGYYQSQNWTGGAGYISAGAGLSTAGTTLTVTTLGSGVRIGQTLSGSGITAGTIVISGSGTSWQVSISQASTSAPTPENISGFMIQTTSGMLLSKYGCVLNGFQTQGPYIGAVQTLNTFTGTGTGSVTYTNIGATGGNGTGLVLSVTTTAGSVTNVVSTSKQRGTGYLVGDIVSFTIPGGSGTATVSALYTTGPADGNLMTGVAIAPTPTWTGVAGSASIISGASINWCDNAIFVTGQSNRQIFNGTVIDNCYNICQKYASGGTHCGDTYFNGLDCDTNHQGFWQNGAAQQSPTEGLWYFGGGTRIVNTTIANLAFTGLSMVPSDPFYPPLPIHTTSGGNLSPAVPLNALIQYSTATSGTATATVGVDNLTLIQSSGATTLGIVWPTAPLDGQRFNLRSEGTVATLNASGTVAAVPTSLSPGYFRQFLYDLTNATWF